MLVYCVLKRNQVKHYRSDIIRTMADSQAFCLRRQNHQSDMIDVFERMFRDESMTDVMLMCEEGSIKAHRMVLSAASPYFKSMFDKMPSNTNCYPIIVLRDTRLSDLRAVIEYIYRGEVTVAQEQLHSVIKHGEQLQVKGLIEHSKEGSHTACAVISKSRKRRRRRRSNDKENKSDAEDGDHKERNDSGSEYSEGDDSPSLCTPTDATISRNYTESVAASEGDIEPSRLLEQTMITGDTQESNNSIHHFSNAHHLSDEDVKPIIYEEPIGLISHIPSGMTSHGLSHDTHSDISHNHLSQVTTASSVLSYDTSCLQSMPGTSDSPQSAMRSHSAHGHKSKTKSPPKKSVHKLQCQVQSFVPRQRFQCNICHQGFTAKRNLQRHMQIHNYYRNKFECDICQRQFSWKHTLNIHKEKTHNIKL